MEKTLSLVFPHSAFSLHIDLDPGDLIYSGDLDDDDNLVAIQGHRVSGLPNHFVIVMLSGQLVETGANFREYQEFRIDGPESDLAMGKFYELDPSPVVKKPSKGARESAVWVGWDDFARTEREVEQENKASVSRRPR
ncbi:MAG: hypothetical protein AAF216_11955 [Pseudomonadota bacterium]